MSLEFLKRLLTAPGPYSVKINPAASGTDGDVIYMTRGGVACGVVLFN